MVEETKFSSLKDALPVWVTNSFDKCLLQLFVSFFKFNNTALMQKLSEHYSYFDSGNPAFLRIIDLGHMKLGSVRTAFSKPRNGVLHWHHHFEERNIESGIYALMGAPFLDTARSGIFTEARARSALASFTSMMSILYGPAAFHSMTYEFVLNCQNGEHSISSPIMENPAFFAIDHIKEVEIDDGISIATRFAGATESARALINVALQFVSRAIYELDSGIKLSNYFSAIDVLAGDVSKNNICALLRVSHRKLEEIGFSALAQKRNNFVHHGKVVRLERNEERTLQYLILDLISGKIGMAPLLFANSYNEALNKCVPEVVPSLG